MIQVTMFGGPYGDRYVDFPNAADHTRSLLKRCADAGISKFVPNFQVGGVGSHPWVICHRAAGSGYTSFRGDYWISPPDRPDALDDLVRIAQDFGIEIHPYVHMACAGAWMPKLRSPVGERIPLGYADRFGSEHPEWWTRSRDGASWLDLDPSDPWAGYGYLSVAYAEVRQYVVSLFERLVQQGVAGVSYEFVTTQQDQNGSWIFGYDTPTLERFGAELGRSPSAEDFTSEAWMQLRASTMTALVTDIRSALAATDRSVEVSIATENVWHAPEQAYRLMVDWPTWIARDLIDTIYPRFWLFQAPDLPTAASSADQIREGVASVQRVAAGRVPVSGGLICASIGGEATRSEMAALLLDGARAAIEGGADGIAIHRVDTIVAHDLWDVVGQIANGDF